MSNPETPTVTINRQSPPLPRPIRTLPQLTPEQRTASIRRTLASAQGEAIWVFAYGSLMWNPCFSHERRVPAKLTGYQRAFCFWSVLARGTPEAPGLGVGLLGAGGICAGIAYRLEASDLDASLQAIWDREMSSGIYRPTWVSVDTDRGQLPAIAFVIDPSHPQYAPPMPADRQAEIIAAARGKFGPCHEYLSTMLEHLAELDVREPELESLMEGVRELLER